MRRVSHIKIQKYLIIAILLSIVTPAFAVEIFFDAKTHEIAVGQQFQVDIALNASGEDINAIEGKIVFPNDILELKKITNANSIINFWIEKPKVESSGQITFCGITPGGYQGGRGLLLSLIFLSKKEGRGIVDRPQRDGPGWSH